jgi:CheY-like chemotaxis protein
MEYSAGVDSENHSASGKKNILLIDDNRDLLDGLESIFSDQGYEVKTAESGFKALDLLRGDFFPDLIVLDVQMPVMSGPEFLDRLEKENGKILREVPVVFSSAGQPPKDRRVQGFIDKMTDLSHYLDQVDRWLGSSPAIA